MTTIAKEDQVFTLINVFRVKRENQQALAKVLTEATVQTMRHLPGFISANIHRSFDGTRVVNYAQWRSKEDFEAMLRSEAAKPHLGKAQELAENADPIVCEVVGSMAAAR